MIFLESVESGFRNPSVYGENLIPELEQIEKEGFALRGYRKTPGGNFTLDGISAQFLGMPLTQLPVDIHDTRKNWLFGGLLSHSDGIFNLLALPTFWGKDSLSAPRQRAETASR